MNYYHEVLHRIIIASSSRRHRIIIPSSHHRVVIASSSSNHYLIVGLSVSMIERLCFSEYLSVGVGPRAWGPDSRHAPYSRNAWGCERGAYDGKTLSCFLLMMAAGVVLMEKTLSCFMLMMGPRAWG